LFAGGRTFIKRMKHGSSVALSFGAGLTITGIGFAALLGADPEEVRAPLAVRLTAPVPALSGTEWVDQFTPLAWMLNVVLWTAVFCAILAPWPRPIETAHGLAVKIARRWRLLILPLAFAASFAIYLLPLGQPSAGQRWRWFLQGMFEVRRIYPNSLVLAETALAAGTQIAVFGVILWVVFGQRSIRFFSPVPLTLFVILLVPRLASVAIPTYCLSAKDTAPPMNLPIACTRAGRFDDRLQHPADVHMEEPWLEYGSLLEMPGCGRKLLDLHPIWGGFTGPGGKIVFVKQDDRQNFHWWYYGGAGSAEMRLRGPEDLRDRVLSSDGELVAWLDRSPQGAPSVVLAAATGANYSIVNLPPLTGWVRLVTVNSRANRIILRAVDVPEPGRPSNGNDRFYEVGMDGRKHWGPWDPVGTATGDQHGLRLLATGWVAWKGGRPNSYKMTQRVVWCVARHCGSQEVHKGRILHSVDVEAEGRFIAIGESALLPFGQLTGVVYVIDTANSSEIFRHYLKKFSRPVVRFPQHGFIAYSDEIGDSISVFELPNGSRR